MWVGTFFIGTNILCFFSAHYAMLQCSWILPKMLKIMFTICVNSAQWMTNTNNNNFYCMCMYIIISCFLLLNHNVYSYNFTVVQYIIHIDCSIKVYQSFSLTCNLAGKDSQYSEIILPIILALCLMLSVTYVLCSKLFQYNRVTSLSRMWPR